MTTVRTLSWAAALIACSLAPALAQNRPIDVRTGLWEFSTQQSMTGMPKMPKMPAIPASVLKNMPPAQRARLEAALHAQRGGGKYVSKVCVTPESLRKGPNFAMRHELNCKRTKYVRTAHGWQMQEVCHHNGRKQTMDIAYKTLDRTRIEGTVHIAARERGHDITIKQTTHGRWLASGCGKLKPME
ncbi:MAG: DUF3617 domain-containing protein [Pseudolabrys sp.]